MIVAGLKIVSVGIYDKRFWRDKPDFQRFDQGDSQQAVGRQSPIRLEAPATVELFAHTQGNTGNLVINLINNVSGISRSTGRLSKGSSHLEMIEHMPPVAEAVLRIRPGKGVKLERAYLAPKKTPLKCEKSGSDHVIRLTNLGVHTMVVVETRA